MAGCQAPFGYKTADLAKKRAKKEKNTVGTSLDLRAVSLNEANNNN